jgi:hypothetical protein
MGIKKTGYISLLAATLAVLAGCNDNPGEKRMPSLLETYSKTDKKPFGAYVAYHQMEEMFFRNSLHTMRRSFDKAWSEINDTSSLYVCISPAFFVNDREIEAIMSYVNTGNDLFISASYIDHDLLKKLGCKLNYGFSFASAGLFPMRDTYAQVADTESSRYSYYYYPFRNYFSELTGPHIKVIGKNEGGQPNCIVCFHGSGRVFLHCDPRAFSNYFLLQHDNYKYMQTLMGFTREAPDHVYWDDFYNKVKYRRDNDRSNSFSSLDELLKHPPLAAAFWLLLLVLILYLAFGVKRRQRVIEVIKPNENTTVTFAETIGRLYLQKKDNKNIADKMITYFNEYIRNAFYLNTNLVNPDFIMMLSRKSGVPFHAVDSLYRAIQHAHQSETIDDYQLLSLNEQIQNFYKNRN